MEITGLAVDNYSFMKGLPTESDVAQNPTSDPFDDLSKVYTTCIPMTNGAARVLVEITAMTQEDLDLYWVINIDGNGLPSEDELYEFRAIGAALEYF